MALGDQPERLDQRDLGLAGLGLPMATTTFASCGIARSRRAVAASNLARAASSAPKSSP